MSLAKDEKPELLYVIKLLVGALAATAVVGIALIMYRPETFLSVNSKLSEDFNKVYAGKPFTRLRVTCAGKSGIGPSSSRRKWSLEFDAPQSPKVETTEFVRNNADGNNSNDICISSEYVIKFAKGGYEVLTTGDEMSEAYNPELTAMMLQAVSKGVSKAQELSSVNSSWK